MSPAPYRAERMEQRTVEEWSVTSPERFTFDTLRTLKAFVVRGGLRVVGVENGPVRLEISEIDASPLTVRHDEEEGVLEVTHGRLGPWRMGASALSQRRRKRAVVSLAVPRDCTVDLSAATAPILVSGLTGTVRVYGGDNHVTLAQLSGPVDVTDFNGHVELMSMSGALTFKSVSADLVAADMTGSIDAESTSGNMTIDTRPSSCVTLRLTSVTGDVTIGLPDLRDRRVHLETTHGRVSTHFPELDEINTRRLSIAKETFGTGRSLIWAKTVSGNIALLRRQSGEIDDLEEAG